METETRAHARDVDWRTGAQRRLVSSCIHANVHECDVPLCACAYVHDQHPRFFPVPSCLMLVIEIQTYAHERGDHDVFFQCQAVCVQHNFFTAASTSVAAAASRDVDATITM